MTPEGLREWAKETQRWDCDQTLRGMARCEPMKCTACDAYRAAGAILRVLEIHSEAYPDDETPNEMAGLCKHCLHPAPCPTVRAMCEQEEKP